MREEKKRRDKEKGGETVFQDVEKQNIPLALVITMLSQGTNKPYREGVGIPQPMRSLTISQSFPNDRETFFFFLVNKILYIYIYMRQVQVTPGVTPKKLHLFKTIDFYKI